MHAGIIRASYGGGGRLLLRRLPGGGGGGRARGTSTTALGRAPPGPTAAAPAITAGTSPQWAKWALGLPAAAAALFGGISLAFSSQQLETTTAAAGERRFRSGNKKPFWVADIAQQEGSTRVMDSEMLLQENHPVLEVCALLPAAAACCSASPCPALACCTRGNGHAVPSSPLR